MRPAHFAVALFAAGISVGVARPQTADVSLAQAILRQLVETNTTDAAGTTGAARAMAQRLLAAGFPAADVQVLGDNANKQNMVARLRGSGTRPPVLLIGHLDVVQARRQDWSSDPFQLVEKNGFFYGRGTQDMKDGDAIFMATLLQFKKEGYKPDRDIILALTAAEEGGADNGVEWLLAHRRSLIQAAFVLNADGGGVDAIHGQPKYLAVDASEKLYADFQLSTTNPGGHSSLPVPDNAIYHLAAALGRLQGHQFPFQLNAVTRGYFAARAQLDTGERAADERALLAASPDAAAARRLSADPLLNALLRTTCVPTRLNAGDANNALPQNAEALVNCRIMPGHSALEIQKQLTAILADPKIAVRYMDNAGALHQLAPAALSNPPVRLSAEVMAPLARLTAAMWPGTPVVPDMATGASDGKYTNAAGLPTYAFSGVAIDEDNVRAHGRDENLGIASFNTGAEFYYRYLKLLTGGS